jgi:LuxR family maltose regulon positive regulatory protein
MHGLFREALYERLNGIEPARAGALHRRAAEHFARQRDTEAAARHFLAAGQVQEAALMVWAAAAEAQGNGRSATLQRWLDLFTTDQVNAFPVLALAAGWVGIDGGDGAYAEHWTTIALNAPADVVLPTGETMGVAATVLEAALGKRGVAAIGEAARMADDGLADDNALKSVAKYLRGTSAYAMDDFDAARTHLLEAQARSAATLATIYSLALGQLAMIAIDEGDWEEAEACTARAALTDRADLQSYTPQSLRFAVQARIAAHRGAEVAAREAAARAKRALATHRHFAPWLAAQTRKVLAAAFIDLEWPAEARRMVAEARRLIASDPDAVRLHRRLDEMAAQVARGNGAINGREALSTAELRTLQYLQTHLSQQEIAERLHLTRNTVHTHASAIYRKLGVTSRSDAVRAGRELGLLDD